MKRTPHIYEAGGGSVREIKQSVRLLLLHRGGWLAGKGCWDAACREDLFPAVGPHLVQVHELAGRGAFREIAALDGIHDAAADAGRSRKNGAALLAAHEGMRHSPLLQKLRAAKSSGAIPGHSATIFAALAAEFFLHPLAMLQAWLFQEWIVRQLDKPAAPVTLFLEACAAQCARLPQLVTPPHGQNPRRFAAI